MNYTAKDYLSEMAHYCGLEDKRIEQNIISRTDEYHRNKQWSEEEIDQFLKAMLRMNDFVRVEMNTTYKLHKGYPSPRSIYPLQLFISIGNGQFVMKDDCEEKYECFHNPQFKANKGDIIIEFIDKYPNNYKNIKKTLLILEAGHLLYNILTIAKLFNRKYKLNQIDNRIQLQFLESNELNIDVEKIEQFNNACKERNSGPFLFPITTVNPYLLENPFSMKADIDDALSNLEHFFSMNQLKEQIEVVYYYNQGNGQFSSLSSDGPKINYVELNEIYPYINFFGATSFVIFLIKNDAFKLPNAINYLLTLGYLNQLIAVNQASKYQYSRPIKSYDMEALEKLAQIDMSIYTPYYCLISGIVI
ncbi:hypothetical protein ACSVDA_00600 [Cytobacillus sp. Hm23]